MLPHWSQDVLPWVCAKCISLTGTNCCPRRLLKPICSVRFQSEIHIFNIIRTNKSTISCSKTKVTIKSFKLLCHMISSEDKNSASNAMVEEGVSDVQPMRWESSLNGIVTRPVWRYLSSQYEIMSLHRHINSLFLFACLRDSRERERRQAWLYKKPYHLTPTTPNPRLDDPSVVLGPPGHG